MTPKKSFSERASDWVQYSLTLRLLTIGFLILILLIPVNMVSSLIGERQSRQYEAVNEISEKWGLSQTLNGLILTVPYYEYSKVVKESSNSNEGNSVTYETVRSTNYMHFLPDQLTIDGAIDPEKRYRGIFEVVVYKAFIQIKGSFSHPDFSNTGIEATNILWEQAQLSFELSDLRGIQNSVAVQWNQHKVAFEPGSPDINNGISAPVPLDTENANVNYAFETQIDFNGSSSLSFTPLGKTTDVSLHSTWPNPSFSGNFLPDQREISEKGFEADWKVLYVNRSYPQRLDYISGKLKESAFGVNLYVPADEYQKSTRAAKYAVLFIMLTFAIFFFVQIFRKIRIHPFQYIVVGLALCVFYTLLISISERLNFSMSYLISSTAIIGIITVFTARIFRNGRITTMIAALLVVLYGFIYNLIQAEDPLLAGSIGLFVILCVLMWVSSKIDWYNTYRKDPEN